MFSSLHKILQKKNLNPFIFDSNTELINQQAPINFHVAWVYKHIYSKSYPNRFKVHGIARPIHGVQHVTRVALYIAIFVNLYKHFGYKDVFALKDEDIKLLQIAALFHDSARENEGVDEWDKESGLFFYAYATKIMLLHPQKAKLFAEAIANKDSETTEYFELLEGTWVQREGDAPKNIYQKLIHDADCLDIIRARDHFEAQYLDFYKDIAKSNEEALDLMAILITEVRSLIAIQGDTHSYLIPILKIEYEHAFAYRDIVRLLCEQKDFFRLIRGLSYKLPRIEDTLYKSLLTENSITKAMNSGKIFARSVGSPAAFYKNRLKENENAAQVEIRKMLRRLGIPTPTSKPNKLDKYGNPNRSLSMIGYGATLYASQGFLVIDPDLDNVVAWSAVDFDTHRGKKKHLTLLEYTPAEKEKGLKELLRHLKMGGSSRYFWHSRPTTHNEILYRITEAHAIYYTQDPTPYNEIMYGHDSLCNKYTHYLQALFLQIEYYKATGKQLDIFHYSSTLNLLIPEKIHTEDEILAMWVEIVSNLLKKNIEAHAYEAQSLETLKIKAIDGYFGENVLIKKQTAMDSNYSPTLQARINAALKEQESNCLSDYYKNLIKEINNGNHLVVFFKQPAHKLNERQRDLILTLIGSQLRTLIKESSEFISLLSLPLEQLNAKQKDTIISILEGQLGGLIDSRAQLLKLFHFPLETLNVAQRDQILIAIEGQLGIIIKDGNQLRNLLKLSLEKLKLLQRDRILAVLIPSLGTIITQGNQLVNLFELPLDKFNSTHRSQVVLAIENQLGTLIKEQYQLYNLFALPLDKLNSFQRTRILEVLQGKLGGLIKNGVDLCSLLMLPLEQLDSKHRDMILAALKSHLVLLIKNSKQLSNLLALPLDKLNASQREQILSGLKGDIKSEVYSGSFFKKPSRIVMPEEFSGRHDPIKLKRFF